MRDKNSFNLNFRRDTADHGLQLEPSRQLPDAPVAPETLLLLDLLVRETCVDLREMSELVSSDLGATLQILRLAGREYGMVQDRPTRIADCIADLGLRACLKAVSADTIGRQHCRDGIADLWAHSREIAVYSKLVAQERSDIHPEEAYMVGLLHEIGLLPSLLGWRDLDLADEALIGFRLAKRWALPHFVTDFFSGLQSPQHASRWSAVVERAHLLAGQPQSERSIAREQRARLQLAGVDFGVSNARP